MRTVPIPCAPGLEEHPRETLNSSPVQRLFGRRTKTRFQLLKPKLPEEVSQKLKLQKAKASLYYNNGAKELEKLHPGDWQEEGLDAS